MLTEEKEKSEEPKLSPIDILEGMKTEPPVFIGFSPKGSIDEPVEIKRWGQFIVNFGSIKKCGYLATSVKGFFLNGGKRFYMLNLGEKPGDLEEVRKRFEEGLLALDRIEEFAFILSPGEDDPIIHESILAYCEKRNTYAILDGPEELIEKKVELEESEEEGSSEETDISSEQSPETEQDEAEDTQPPVSGAQEESEKYENMPNVAGKKGVVIYPWIYLKDRVMGDFYIPASGHIAGILCRLYNENARPAYSEIEGTILLKYKFPQDEIEKYSERGIVFLKYPTKRPGLVLR